MKHCCICGQLFEGYGNDPRPVTTRVIPAYRRIIAVGVLVLYCGRVFMQNADIDIAVNVFDFNHRADKRV